MCIFLFHVAGWNGRVDSLLCVYLLLFLFGHCFLGATVHFLLDRVHEGCDHVFLLWYLWVNVGAVAGFV